jgi:CHAD domain-containing protein
LLGKNLTADANAGVALDRAIGEFALVMLAKDRDAALAALVRTTRRVPVKRLTASARRLIRSVEDDPEGDGAGGESPGADRAISLHVSVRTAGHAALAAIAREFQTAGQADLSCRENLHQLRLCGKRLRYALEIFGAAEEDPKPLVGLANHLAKLQERLGEVNDHHEVAERLQNYAADAAAAIVDPSSDVCVLADGLRKQADRFEQRCVALSSDFLQWWRSHDADEFHRLIDMLAGRETALSTDERIPEVVVLAKNGSVGVGGESVAATAASGASSNDEGGQDQ